MQNLDSTYGTLFICLVLSSVLYGVTLLQTFLYYRQYPNDPWSMKSLVFLLWALDTAHLVLCAITIYISLITNYNNPDIFLRFLWSMNLQIDCNGLIGIIAQCFFARRVLMMTGNLISTVVIVVCGCMYFGLGILLTVKTFEFPSFDELPKLRWIIGTGLGCAAAADVIIAAALCYHLTKRRTGFARTDSLISTLVMYCLTTGLITSVIAVACVAMFQTMPMNYTWIGLFWIIGRCYVNSVLAALNVRVSLRERMAVPENTFLHLSAFNDSPSWLNGTSVAGVESKENASKEYRT